MGYCSNSKSTIANKCMESCQLCRPCVDIRPLKCRVILKYNLCEKKPHIATTTCRASCHRCGKSDPCHGFVCKKGTTCQTDHKGKAFCGCKQKCKSGDHFTGTVCGRDNKEYKNLCALKSAFCHEKDAGVNVRAYGHCPKALPTNSMTPQEKKLKEMCDRIKDKPFCSLYMKVPNSCSVNHDYMMGHCPHACGFCKLDLVPKAYSPPKDIPCDKTLYGCCLDMKSSAHGPQCQGCPDNPKCRDRSRSFCKKFVPACGLNSSKKSMLHYCPHTCNYCTKK